MANHPQWSDEYWLLLMQLYMKKPIGIKPLYSRAMVDLALMLHIEPKFLYDQMFFLQKSEQPSLKLLWDKYSKHPKKLEQKAKLIQEQFGFQHADTFFQDVDIHETWEKDFRPLEADKELSPIKLIMILNLYFQLTPVTMVPETPEIEDLAKLIHLNPEKITNIMDIYQICDPYLTRDSFMAITPLLKPCEEIWKRFGNEDPQNLYTLASQLKEYCL